MTDYNAFEISEQSGQPTEFYEFVLSDTQYNYTSAEDEITIGAITYLPISIARSNILLGVEQRQEILTITMPSGTAPADEFIAVVPGQICTLTIKRRHRTDTPTPELIVIYKGIVRSVAYTKNGYESELAVVPLTYGLGKEVPRFTYQGLCNHILYDTYGCKVSSGSFSFTGEVTNVDGNVLTIPGIGSGDGYPDKWWTGGYVQYQTNDWRLIIDHTGEDITLLLPFPSNVDGQDVTIFAGCDHTIAVCKAKFNNVENYGGFAFVPQKDIFRNGID